jgi:hypothetical protein
VRVSSDFWLLFSIHQLQFPPLLRRFVVLHGLLLGGTGRMHIAPNGAQPVVPHDGGHHGNRRAGIDLTRRKGVPEIVKDARNSCLSADPIVRAGEFGEMAPGIAVLGKQPRSRQLRAPLKDSPGSHSKVQCTARGPRLFLRQLIECLPDNRMPLCGQPATE